MGGYPDWHEVNIQLADQSQCATGGTGRRELAGAAPSGPEYKMYEKPELADYTCKTQYVLWSKDFDTKLEMKNYCKQQCLATEDCKAVQFMSLYKKNKDETRLRQLGPSSDSSSSDSSSDSSSSDPSSSSSDSDYDYTCRMCKKYNKEDMYKIQLQYKQKNEWYYKKKKEKKEKGLLGLGLGPVIGIGCGVGFTILAVGAFLYKCGKWHSRNRAAATSSTVNAHMQGATQTASGAGAELAHCNVRRRMLQGGKQKFNLRSLFTQEQCPCAFGKLFSQSTVAVNEQCRRRKLEQEQEI